MQRLVALFMVAATASGCSYERTSNSGMPTAPSDLPPLSSGEGSGTLTGVWASPAVSGIPGDTTCSSVQWRINSQTETSLIGEFYASCSYGIVVAGIASGQLNGNDVSVQVSGTGTLPGIVSCPFSLNGAGQIQGDTMPLHYTGDTCFGPVQGQTTLRRPSASEPEPPPPPAPEPPPASAANPFHIGAGPLTAARAEQVVYATGNEYAHLRAPRATNSEAIAASEELLLRTIWHLQLAGFDAARQKNPSGAISNDKLTLFADGRWETYDIFLDYGNAGRETQMIFYPVGGANPQPNPGIPD
jgi:hypothetical protein